MENKFKGAIALGGFILFAIIIGVLSAEKDDRLLINSESDIQNGDMNFENPTNEIKSGEEVIKKIYIHIIGAVNEPGIVALPENSRIYEAIEKAGGLKENADDTILNLAKILQDEEQIIVPYKQTANKNAEVQNINKLFENSTQNIQNNTVNSSGKININTATKEELKTLTGIGESTAEKIINYRNKNSKFQKIEDIKNVSGIGDSKFNAIKDKIVVK